MSAKLHRAESTEVGSIYRQDFHDSTFEEDPNALLNEVDEEREQKLVVRFVPKAIDCFISLIQLTILGSFFYVAYIWGELDSEPGCFADINSQYPLMQNSDNKAVDVQRYFKIAIRWGFWMSLLTFTRAILAQVGLYLKRWVMLWCSYVLFAANISISIVLFILMQVWRWSHAGQVCSGDFRTDNDPDDLPDKYYLTFEGKFIKAILIAIYSILGLSCLSIIIVSICVYKRHAEEDRLQSEQDPSGMSFKESRQTVFNRALDPDYEAAMRESSRSEMNKKFFDEQNQQKEDKQKLLSA